MTLLLLKIAFLFTGIFFTVVNASRAYYKNVIPSSNFFLQTIGITGFIVLQFLI